MAGNNHEAQSITTFELIKRAYRFIRLEIAHAGVALAVFGIIFIILKPWDNERYTNDAHAFWFVGPPLIYFSLDLLSAMYLHFSLKKELYLQPCFIWIGFQFLNLTLLTVLGSYMVWSSNTSETYWRMSLALLILLFYKMYRIMQMHKLIHLIKLKIQQNIVLNTNHVHNQTIFPTGKQPYAVNI